MLYGGDAMLKDKDGMTPLDWANREGQIECADLLRFWHYNLESSRSTPNAVRLHFVDQLKHSSSPPLRYPMSPDKENQQPKFFSNPITPSSQSFSSTPPRCLNTSSSSYSPRFFKSPIKEPLVKVKSSPARKATRLSELNGEKGITEEPELTWLCSTFSSTVSTNEPSHSSDPTWREEDDDEDYSQFSGRLSVISEEHSSGDITIVNENFNKTVKRPTTKTEKEDVKCRMSMAVCEDIFPPAANIPTPDISDNSADTSHESFEGLDIPNDIFTFVVGLTNAALKRELISRGIDVGPITQTTRLLYERKLGILLLERRSSDQLSKFSRKCIIRTTLSIYLFQSTQSS